MKQLATFKHPLIQKYRMALLALALVFFAFPDVFFTPASLAAADYIRWDGTLSSVSFNSAITKYFKGFWDMGATLWQSEPKISLIRHAILNGENPYWNPYAGSGMLGPEALTDVKFSPLTLLSALLGGSSLAITFVTLFFLGLGCYFLIRACHKLLDLPLTAGVAAATVYMLNGFQTTGLAGNYSQPYLLFPIYLYALLAFVKHGGVARFIAAYFAAALVMMVTFIPTMTMAIITVTLLGIGYAWGHAGEQRWKKIGVVVAVPIVAALLVAFIYLPALDALSLSQDAEVYAKRQFYPLTINGLLSVFTPMHLWQSYRYNLNIMGEPSYPLFMGNVAFHIGIVGGFLMLFSLSKKMPRGILIAAWVVMFAVILRIFGVPLFEYGYWQFPAHRNTAIIRTIGLLALAVWWATKKKRTRWLPLALLIPCLLIFGIDFYEKAISALPIIGRFGLQYVWIVPMVCLPILVAYGINEIVRGTPIIRRARYYLGFLFLFLLYLVALHPLKDYNSDSIAIRVAVFLISLIVIYWVCKREASAKQRAPMAFLLLALLYTELWFYMPHLHPLRTDPYHNPPEYISYIQENIGEHRILNLGNKGIMGEVASAFQIPDVGAMTMNVPSDYVDFFVNDFLPKEYNFNNFPGFAGATDTGKLDFNLASLLGIKYLITPKEWSVWESTLKGKGFRVAHESHGIRVYENPKPWPRSFVIAAPASTLTIDEVKNNRIGLKNLHAAEFTHYGSTRVSIAVDAPKAGTLVLTDNWYPYWRATVNGQEVDVDKVFKTFRGVAVPEGKSQVEFYYENPAVALGIRISVVLAIASILLLSFQLFQNCHRMFTHKRI
jgi:hypothetical protein